MLTVKHIVELDGFERHLRRQHTAIWAVIDHIAADREVSASALAKASGYDATTFNKSKRFKGEELRWPSSEAISRVLLIGRLSFAEFGAKVDERMSRQVV